jgi:hypothetical protein
MVFLDRERVRRREPRLSQALARAGHLRRHAQCPLSPESDRTAEQVGPGYAGGTHQELASDALRVVSFPSARTPVSFRQGLTFPGSSRFADLLQSVGWAPVAPVPPSASPSPKAGFSSTGWLCRPCLPGGFREARAVDGARSIEPACVAACRSYLGFGREFASALFSLPPG